MLEETWEKGQFPISIATSLALEGLLGIHPDRPPTNSKLGSYQLIRVNVETMLRNLLGAIHSSYHHQISPIDWAEMLSMDMSNFNRVIRDRGSGRCEVEFYFQAYPKLVDKLPTAKHRKDMTSQQRILEDVSSKVFPILNDYLDEDIVINEYKWSSQSNKDTLILTHIVLDLLCRNKYPKLHLLESHTGRVKTFQQWSSKLPNCGYKLMPLNWFTVQVFGDVQHMYSQSFKLKKAVIDLAAEKNWTPNTTLSRIKDNIKMIKVDDHRDYLLVMINSALKI